MQADIEATWRRREEAKKSHCVNPNKGIVLKAAKKAGGQESGESLQDYCAELLLDHVLKLKARSRKADQPGFNEHLTARKLKKSETAAQFIKDEDDTEGR